MKIPITKNSEFSGETSQVIGSLDISEHAAWSIAEMLLKGIRFRLNAQCISRSSGFVTLGHVWITPDPAEPVEIPES